MTIRISTRMTRRRLLASAGSAAALVTLDGIARPYISRAADRPLITHGIQSGDVSLDSGMVWARTVAEGLRHQPSVSHPSAQRRNQRARLAA